MSHTVHLIVIIASCCLLLILAEIPAWLATRRDWAIIIFRHEIDSFLQKVIFFSVFQIAIIIIMVITTGIVLLIYQNNSWSAGMLLVWAIIGSLLSGSTLTLIHSIAKNKFKAINSK